MAAQGDAPTSALPLPEATPTLALPEAWRAIDFISDLHLDPATPGAFDAWAAHLRYTHADAVFILGDLFEVWVGDDIGERGFEARCTAVLGDAARHRTVGFMAGNRDFLVGDALLESLGVMRLHDPTLLVAFGQPVLVSHGDALCLGDAAYQRYRRIVRRPAVQHALLTLPRRWRSAIGRRAREQSGAMKASGPVPFVDVDAEAARGWLRDSESQVLVHGHTHAPASHVLGSGLVRHVLSDWHLDGAGSPRAEVLRWTDAGFARIAPESAIRASELR
ncbi:MAG: UDP-2,3-diacylglucosamine diphosphatase [Caldimonas sp.]